MSSPTTTTPTRDGDAFLWDQKFVARIQRACEFPGQRAALRSGLRRDVDDSPRMHSLVATLVPNVDRGHDARERAWYAVAAMIASLPRAARRPRAGDTEEAEATSSDPATPADGAEGAHGTGHAGDASAKPPPAKPRRRRNLGVCLAEAVARKAIRDTTAEARLDLLCRQSVEGLHRHLPSTIRQLATTPDAIDWTQLLRDLRGWEDHREAITRRWLQAYYRARFAAEREQARAADDAEQRPQPLDQP